MAAASFTLLPWAALIIGAVIALRFHLPEKAVAALQHLAAGVVFAAAGTEILPLVEHGKSMAALLIGSALGLITMFAVKEIGGRFSGNMALVILIIVDIFIDGVVLGIAFSAGETSGMILLLALSLEILFLGLTAVEELREVIAKQWKIIAALAVGGLALPLGALLGGPVHRLPVSLQEGIYAFALIALLYLVTEELLVEAHDKPDSPAITSTFFIGFIGLLAIEKLV